MNSCPSVVKDCFWDNPSLHSLLVTCRDDMLFWSEEVLRSRDTEAWEMEPYMCPGMVCWISRWLRVSEYEPSASDTCHMDTEICMCVRGYYKSAEYSQGCSPSKVLKVKSSPGEQVGKMFKNRKTGRGLRDELHANVGYRGVTVGGSGDTQGAR